MRLTHHPIAIQAAAVVTATVAALVILPLIPGYLHDSAGKDNFLPITPMYVTIFGVFSTLMIGIVASVHRLISGEYGRIQRRRSLWFFIPFATVFGVVLGEAANDVVGRTSLCRRGWEPVWVGNPWQLWIVQERIASHHTPATCAPAQPAYTGAAPSDRTRKSRAINGATPFVAVCCSAPGAERMAG